MIQRLARSARSARPARPALLAPLALLLLVVAGPAAAQELVVAPPPAPTGPRLDVVFAIDATGSMGDEIEQVKNHLWSTANRIVAGNPRPDVRFGLVIYRDRSDREHTRRVPLTRDVDAIHRELMEIVAQGGGDNPEDVDAALEIVVDDMAWANDAAHLVFLIGDAPPKQYGVDRGALLRRARQKEIAIHTVQASGMDRIGSTAFEAISESTGGHAEVLTYRANVRVAGRDVMLLRRGSEAFVTRRALDDDERGLSFEELRRRRLVRPAPAELAAAATGGVGSGAGGRRHRRSSLRRPGRPGGLAGGPPRASGGSGGSAAAPAASFDDSDIGGIVSRAATEAAAERGVSY